MNQQKNYLKEKAQLEKCPFYPNVNITNELSTQKLEETLDKLYQDSKNRDSIKLNNLETKKKAEEQSLAKIKFVPETNNQLDKKIFVSNPLKDDIENVQKRLEKARVEKKINELRISKGSNHITKKDLEALKTDENLPNFNCTIERQLHKDTFEIFTPKSTKSKFLLKKRHKVTRFQN